LQEVKRQTAESWRSFIQMVMMKSGGQATLEQIYGEVLATASEKITTYSGENWKAKIRQILQFHFEKVDRGIYALPLSA
jgi:hypothetical protein